MGHAKAPHHRGQHDTLSAIARRTWYANPNTRCARCGLTHAEGITRYGPKRAAWEAGHRIDGTIAHTTADYQPEHATCNRSAGASHGNRNREPRAPWPPPSA